MKHILPLHALLGTASNNFQVHRLQVLRWSLIWSAALVALMLVPSAHCIPTLNITCVLLCRCVLIVFAEQSPDVGRFSLRHIDDSHYVKLLAPTHHSGVTTEFEGT